MSQSLVATSARRTILLGSLVRLLDVELVPRVVLLEEELGNLKVELVPILAGNKISIFKKFSYQRISQTPVLLTQLHLEIRRVNLKFTHPPPEGFLQNSKPLVPLPDIFEVLGQEDHKGTNWESKIIPLTDFEKYLESFPNQLMFEGQFSDFHQNPLFKDIGVLAAIQDTSHFSESYSTLLPIGEVALCKLLILSEKEGSFGKDKSLINIAVLFLRLDVFFPCFFVEWFNIATQFQESSRGIYTVLFLQIQRYPHKISQPFTNEVQRVYVKVESSKVAFNGLLPQRLHMDAMLSVELPEGRLQLVFEVRSLWIFQDNVGVKAKRLKFRQLGFLASFFGLRPPLIFRVSKDLFQERILLDSSVLFSGLGVNQLRSPHYEIVIVLFEIVVVVEESYAVCA